MRTHPDGREDIRRLFREQAPELVSGVVEIKAIARERGQRSVLAVSSRDPSVDPVGVCVGQRGVRVKSVVQQLPGEQVDIIRWSESVEEFIRNALAPVVVRCIALDAAAHQATVTVDSQRSDAHAVDPIRLKLASKVIGWELHLVADMTEPPSDEGAAASRR